MRVPFGPVESHSLGRFVTDAWEPVPPPAGDTPRDLAYRGGYRSGFDDGIDAAQRLQQTRRESDADGKKKSGSDDQDDAKQGDESGKDDAKAAGADGDASKKGGADARKGAAKDDKDEKDDKKDDKKDGKPPLWKRPVVVLLAFVVIVVAIIAILLALHHAHRHATTDDAFIDGNASQIAAQAAGRVTRLYVRDNQIVHAGDPLIEIDAADVQARVDQATAQVLTAKSHVTQADSQVETQRANVAQAAAQARDADAEATNAHQDVERYRHVDPDAVAKQQEDAAVQRERSARAKVDAARATIASSKAQVKNALAQVASAEADVATAEAELHAAQLQVGYTHVVAPIDGRVTKRGVDVGNVISVGQPLLAIVSNDLWVTANYKETQLTHMQVGQAVDIVVDAYPDIEFHGHVDSIALATGAYFSMLPAENATGNYVKVVQRVPVKITFDHLDVVGRYAIGPGMSVRPDVLLH
ncbi:MAG TPA: HlyD family secretion protein [Burkholderiaceae bacterium]|jgi:membrane fusion protein (multidrug efflux system)|nr:HlyD family secretion protein [Burkholderiaceae bacterium]